MSLPARLLLVPALVSLALAGSPAHAGRASACKAPPFAVPKETQRAVDAAIDARVVATGAGAVSSSVETRTDYETTTLSQDAVARAWTEYTLCLKLAKKLISQDLHDELLRDLLRVPAAPPLEIAEEALPAAPATEPSTPAVAHTPQDLVGTWQIVTTFRWSNCPAPNDKGGVNAYSWLVSVKPDDTVEVAVVGRTSYPRLTGRLEGDMLLLSGEQVRSPVDGPNGLVTSDGTQYVAYRPRVAIAMAYDGTSLLGSRDLVTLVGPVGITDGFNEYDLCLVHHDIRATR